MVQNNIESEEQSQIELKQIILEAFDKKFEEKIQKNKIDLFDINRIQALKGIVGYALLVMGSILIFKFVDSPYEIAPTLLNVMY